MPTAGKASNIFPLRLTFAVILTELVLSVKMCVFRLKAAEETFRQAREKATYNIKPKHASGIVSILVNCELGCVFRRSYYTLLLKAMTITVFLFFPVPFRKPSWDRRCEFLCYLIATNPLLSIIHTFIV